MATTTWTVFKDLQSSEKRFLYEITAILAATPATTETLYLSTSATTINDKYYEPCVVGVPKLKKTLQHVLSGRIQVSWGNIECLHQENYIIGPINSITFEDLFDGTWLIRNQDITIKYGGESLPYSEYQTIFTGKCRRLIGWNERSFNIEIVDRWDVMGEKLITPNTVTSGSVPANTGLVQPFVVGFCYNVRPIFISSTTDAYLVHDDETEDMYQVYDVYENGVGVSITDNGDGTFTLDTTATGLVTCDVQGAELGSGTFEQKVGSIIENILLSFGGLSAGDIDSTSVSNCDTDFPDNVFYYFDKKTTIFQAIEILLTGLPIYCYFDRAGKFFISEFEAPSGSEDIEIDETQIISIRGETENTCIWKQKIKYDRNFTVMSGQQLDGSLTLVQKSVLEKDWYETESSTSSIKDKFPLATVAETESCLKRKTAAETVAAKWVTLYGAHRRRFKVTVHGISLDYELHSEVKLTYSKFGLDSGDYFRIIGIEEDYGNNQVTLELWG